MKIGLYGYQGAGSTTLFNAITGQQAAKGQDAKQQINVAAVKVPEPRLYQLAPLYKPQKIVHAEILFHDLCLKSKETGRPGRPVRLPPIQEIRNMDLLCLVVRGFDSLILSEAADPRRDLDEILTEMTVEDMEVLERYKERQQKLKDKDAFMLQHASAMIEDLSNGRHLRTCGYGEDTRQRFKGFSLVTLKPLLVVINQEESKAPDGKEGKDGIGRLDGKEGNKAQDGLDEKTRALLDAHGCQWISLCASMEEEIAFLPEEEQAPFLADLGLAEPLSRRFIRAVYEMADYITFFTVGEDEVRAWPVQRGSSSRSAAGVIHTDLMRGFIRAEVFSCEDLLAYGSEQALKKAGKLRLEGKEYEVKDGDVLSIRFKV